MTTLTIGIDVSLKTLDVAVALDSQRATSLGRFANEAAGYKELAAKVEQVAQGATIHLIMEPTGGYELPLAQFARERSWLVSLPNRNVTVVDSLWGLGFVLAAWVTFALADGFSGRRWLVTVLTTLWGLRLCTYLSYRNWGKGEDPRYGKGGRQAGKSSGSSACSRSSGCRRFFSG